MEKILSGCPVLEVLLLEGCFGLSCLNICSPNLTTLTIKDGEFYDIDDEDVSFLEISAPYLRDLTISCDFEEINFKIRNLSSVVRASFFFSVDEGWEIYMPPDITNYVRQLLESLQSLKELELRPWCIEIFSMLEMKGWKLKPSLLCLTLNPCSNRGSIPGILGFLKSYPNLNTLVIRGSHVSDDEIYVTHDQAASYLQNGDLDLVLFHLKTIKIIGFEGLVSEPMLMLLQVLLKSAKVLETMVISAEEESIETSSTNATSTDLAKFASKLVALPKASPKAVVFVR
ncbi:hypothetical protein ACJIZ3_019479 [Penstemon smallii]|uniref:FBD domain-containing protein n=1 Tax=Penstemon smallii TaxID=265156 RepID=A0ABD3T2U0_9LAMI